MSKFSENKWYPWSFDIIGVTHQAFSRCRGVYNFALYVMRVPSLTEEIRVAGVFKLHLCI